MNNPILDLGAAPVENLLPYEYDTVPLFFRLSEEGDIGVVSDMIKGVGPLTVADTIHAQLRELLKSRNPGIQYADGQLDEAVREYLGGLEEWRYGVWVYYPWSRRLVHVLDEQEFTEVRTNRNQYKITPEEREVLAAKKVGVIGLSVGQSVALTLAMERGFGELRIGDFDTLELSNMNRIRTGVHNLGVPKTVIVKREIAEIDPFLQVSCFHEGVTADNIGDFLHESGTLDILIDECDSLDIKVLCRRKAREAGIPVLMDTSDRGMIDIERFDNEPSRELLHGLVKGIDGLDLGSITRDERVHLSLQIAGGDALSDRMKASIPHIGKTISTWPQLASSVALGGAATTQICSAILLGKTVKSGRYYIDVDQIIAKDFT